MNKITPEQWEGLFRRLNQGGCPVRRDHGYKMPPYGLAIEKLPGISLSQVFDLEHGGTGYALEFLLQNDLDRPIDVQGFQIQTPWGTPKLSLLPAPRKSSCYYPHYMLPDKSRHYEAEYVLNPIFARRKTRLKPGEEVVGVLVALGEVPIPDEFPDQARVLVRLSIFDSRRNQYSAKFEPLVDRKTALCLRELAKKRREENQPAYSRKREPLSSADAAA